MNIQEISNQTPLTFEEGYELTKFYVKYFWTKYYSLQRDYEEDDVVSILMIKFMKHDLFEKYNGTTSKKYHVMNSVRTSMIDLLRKQKPVESLDEENEEGTTKMEMLVAPVEVDTQVFGDTRRNYIIDSLPEVSKSSIVGYSPLFKKEVNISFRMLALHLEAGYKAKDMAEFYKNPVTNKPVSEGTISSYIRDMREYILDNIVLA